MHCLVVLSQSNAGYCWFSMLKIKNVIEFDECVVLDYEKTPNLFVPIGIYLRDPLARNAIAFAIQELIAKPLETETPVLPANQTEEIVEFISPPPQPSTETFIRQQIVTEPVIQHKQFTFIKPSSLSNEIPVLLLHLSSIRAT